MKFVLKKPELEKEPIIKLELVEKGEGIDVYGHKKDGYWRIICRFSDGKLILCGDAELPGLETDEEGKIKIQ